jgi:hypothetical protein
MSDDRTKVKLSQITKETAFKCVGLRGPFTSEYGESYVLDLDGPKGNYVMWIGANTSAGKTLVSADEMGILDGVKDGEPINLTFTPVAIPKSDHVKVTLTIEGTEKKSPKSKNQADIPF